MNLTSDERANSVDLERVNELDLNEKENSSATHKEIQLSERDSSQAIRRVQLRRSGYQTARDAVASTWVDLYEKVIQYSLRELTELYSDSHTITPVRDLESTIFSRALTDVCLETRRMGEHVPPQLALFSRPVGLVSFQVHTRRYMCIKHPVTTEAGLLQANNAEYLVAIERLAKAYSSEMITLRHYPTTTELLSNLLDHLQEEIRQQDDQRMGQLADEIQQMVFHKVHPARRSAIRDWQNRLEEYYTEQYNHEEEAEEEAFYSYPIVDILVPDATHLLLLFISPLDLDFVDEKVTEDHRCAEITLAIYNVERTIYPGAVQELTPFIKQAFARVLFTSMHRETSQALQDSIESQSVISHYWVSEASEGYQALMGDERASAAFDGMEFCKEVVKQILCARIPGVKTEVYPFDRAFIFREAGISSLFDKQVPIEMLVLEASVLSNNPADRGRFLTRRERQIRGTEDYECDVSQKVILDDNVFRFYIHGSEQGLILSRQKQLSKDSLQEIGRNISSRSAFNDPESKPFFIPIPDPEHDDDVFSLALHNLFGRLIPGNYMFRAYQDPAGELGDLFQTEAFTREFEQRRLMMTESYDERGLYFRYEHGVILSEDIPLLFGLQTAYFHYLDLKFKDLDHQYRQEVFRQENLEAGQITELLERFRKKQRQARYVARRETYQANKRQSSDGQVVAKQQASRAIYISFSWMLHDENMQNLLMRHTPTLVKDESPRALLSDEYTYTMILIADTDPGKSFAQLNAERENLRLFFQMMMHRIWVDKIIEQSYLERRIQSISAGLAQFLHRAKALIPDRDGRQEIDNLFENLKHLMLPEQVVFETHRFTAPEQIFTQLLGEKEYGTKESILDELYRRAAHWFTEELIEKRGLVIQALFQNIPNLSARWPSTIVNEAFYIAFKNACEAALEVVDEQHGCQVTTHIRLVHTAQLNQQESWFLDIVIENTGGPIPTALLDTLNATTPTPVDRNQFKKGSTGVGVYLARSQLQSMVGAGADLTFLNLQDGWVQTQLRLPVDVEKIDTVSDARYGDSLATIPLTQEYALYIEDSPEIYEEVIPSLEEALTAYQLVLEHRRGSQDALKLVESKMPIAIFTDLHILKSDASAEAPALAYGVRFLLSVIEAGQNQPFKPPIWVLTAEEESKVREQVGNIANKGYRFVPSEDTDIQQLARSGTISVFSDVKHPHTIEQFPAFLYEISSCKTIPSWQMEDEKQYDIHQPTDQTFEIQPVRLRDTAFEELAALYSQVYDPEQPGIVIVEDDCPDLAELAEALSLWFGHSGLPSADPFLASEDMIYRLTNHVWHKKLVLHLKIEESLHEQLPLQLLYWGLSNNIWFGSPDSDAYDVAQIWLGIANEDRGPLSQLRHDLKNQWNKQELQVLLTSALTLIGETEQVLKYPEAESSQLKEILNNNSNAVAYLGQVLVDTAEKELSRQRCRRILQQLDEQFPAATEIDAELKSKNSSHRQMLQLLDTYLWESGNVD